MKVLLDENFPLLLYHRLREAGYDVDHIIALGQRGLPDRVIRKRLAVEDLVFVTHDTEFLDVPDSDRATIIVSRVRQNLPIATRVDIWFPALARFILNRPVGPIFELLETGEIVPWEIKAGS